MKKSKKIFFTLVSIFSILIICMVAFMIYGIIFDNRNGGINQMILPLILVPVVILIMIVVICLIGRFVYSDAKRRGMDPWLWTTIAVFIPNLIGLIIYLIERNSLTKKACINCGKPLDENFVNCPFCGRKVKDACSSCGEPIKPEWNVCPVCSNKLK